MLDFPRWKVWAVSLSILVGLLLALPSLIAGTTLASKYPTWLPSAKINLGLDLAGGSHLLLEADLQGFAKQRLARMEETVQTEMRRDPRIEIGDVSTSGGRLTFMVRDPRQVDDAVERMRTVTRPVGLTGTRDWDVQVIDTTRVVMTPTADGSRTELRNTMTSARDIVRRRIDPQGTKEVTVINQGERRILVQVPGVENPEALKALIGQTARLEFKLVDLDADPALVAQCRAPAGSEALPMVDQPTACMAVKRRTIVDGENLTSAKQSFDENGNPAISFTFDTAGAKRFGRVTQENIGKPFAIILDSKVLSAPNIQSAILGGQGQITGNFTVESANQLAIALSSGRLPVKLNVIEERTVGPELGKDSIRKGAIASIVATFAVILFMLVTYGRFGVYATLGLIVNAILILAGLAVFGSALTLPGIAGFVLTIGAAVDANVLINERIREEQRRGRRVLDSIETGYKEASTAIFDANITNVIAAALMWYFGSGPVRGFAVVLMIGIVTSVFTAVNFTRMLVAIWVRRKRPRELHI
ncbi:protein translocase subunit SecD [Sphingomonas piscis]|uniref:Protein translocase subunit SecD n=1 Tax=Sphingomonas piscis TaxID=2714943 RepID=A0A6G7YNX4_9SPHN|nr:protein translocase subunit SecD [Sphingomonas piscis]QIK78426.1 protein translocase subunit SecD [Sphingomonas piscis]